MVLGLPGRVDPDFIRAQLMRLHYLNNLLVLDFIKLFNTFITIHDLNHLLLFVCCCIMKVSLANSLDPDLRSLIWVQPYLGLYSGHASLNVAVVIPFHSGYCKQVLWQTVKTLIKCCIRQHFIMVCTIC